MKRPPVTRRDVASALVLGTACGGVYVLLAEFVGPALSETPESSEIGAMWAVVATIFVFRASLTDSLSDARSRLWATTMSLVLCLAYLLVFDVTAVGVAIVIGLGSLLAATVGRPQDAVTTGITSIVVLVVADLGQPAQEWAQPLLRMLDTVIGIAVGLPAACIVGAVAAGATRSASPQRLEGVSS